MALLSFSTLAVGRPFARRAASFCLGGLILATVPSAAEAACVTAALNRHGEQIEGTRSVTRGIFPAIVCERALNRCERRLERLRDETGRRRPHARCEIIASGHRAAETYGPPLEGAAARRGDRGPGDYRYDDDPRPGPDVYSDRGYRRDDLSRDDYRRDDYARDDYRPEEYGDRRDPRDGYLDPPGSHDGWRAAEDDPRNDPLEGLLDDPLGDDRAGAPRDGYRPDGYPRDDYADGDQGAKGYPPALPPDLRDDPYSSGPRGDRYADGCNFEACSERYKTFRSSDCSYKPNLYERRRCPL